MSKEEAERQEAEQQAAQRAGIGSTEATRQSSERQHAQHTNTDNSVIQMVENQAIKTEMRGSSEDFIPERTLTTIRSPSTEHANDRNAMTLPIVDEVGESSSTGGQSGRSNHDEDERHPPKPPKDKLVGPSSKKPVSTRGSSFDSNKELPPIPKAMNPEPMEEKNSAVAR
jgi:1-phosphatidylinositol-4-phosphate 5-kinase